MYKKTTFLMRTVCLILLCLIAWKDGVFEAVANTSFIKCILNNTYFSGVACSIIAVVIVYRCQVWYCKRKLKQDLRCNECISEIYDGIETFWEYSRDIPNIVQGEEYSNSESRSNSALQYAEFYKNHKGEIFIANLELSGKGKDLLIESIQACFFINLNFKLLGIVNNIKNRLPNLRDGYPKIEELYKNSKELSDEEVSMKLDQLLQYYFMDVKFMAMYWKELLDYLEYDPTYIKLFVKKYNEKYNFEDELKESVALRSDHINEVAKEAKKTMVVNRIREFWNR